MYVFPMLRQLNGHRVVVSVAIVVASGPRRSFAYKWVMSFIRRDIN